MHLAGWCSGDIGVREERGSNLGQDIYSCDFSETLQQSRQCPSRFVRDLGQFAARESPVIRRRKAENIKRIKHVQCFSLGI